ncbi:MAG: T9SS type A sorting domain-containing protein [Flavobacteriales bacterium]
MRLISICILFFISFANFAQESLEPLGINPTLARKTKPVQRSIDELFIYAIDTIHLPIKDDFSTDRFKKYNAKSTDANVYDSLFYVIYNGVLPEADTARYMLDTTYHYQYTPTATPDSFQIDTFPLAPIGLRTICDLDVYPVVCNTVMVWPAYNTDDTIGTAANPDNFYGVFPPDVEQDSAQVFFVKATDTQSYWQDNYVYLNNDYAINPPTIGVVTFDGLNENGYPYDFSTAFTYGKADYLTSKPIFLDTKTTGFPYTLSDSIYLSFYYQPQGLGNEPELEDSLVLQFYSPNDSEWVSMWKVDGAQLDTNFKQVMIKITDARFLEAGFKFRFVNYASLSGSFDHWNIDYVFLDQSRFSTDDIRDDVAFQLPSHTLLKKYTAMPWKHFKWETSAAMKDSILVNQRNNNAVGRLIGGNTLNIFYQSALQQTIPNPNTPSISGMTNFTTEYKIPSGYFYDTSVNDTNASFLVEVKHNTTPDFCRMNDTLRFIQEFSDFYSYDDGTAEAAYGVQGLGGLNSKIASRFSLTQGDSIKSVFIHFTPSAYNMSSTPFIITLWSESGNKPGSIMYEKVALDVPRYNLGVNGFYEYPLDSNHFLPAGSYFVGISQTTPDRINIGFDKNINNLDNTFYNSNGVWQKSGFEGTLMIRPSFVYQRDYSVGLNEDEVLPQSVVFPNPANSQITVQLSTNEKVKNIDVIDLTGKLVISTTFVSTLDVANLKNGMYVMRITDEKNRQFITRFVKN